MRIGRTGADDHLPLRKELLAGLTGRVLELGPGTGLNFEHYPSTVDVVIAVEPEVTLRQKAAEASSATAAGPAIPWSCPAMSSRVPSVRRRRML